LPNGCGSSAGVGFAVVSLKLVVPAETGATKVDALGVNVWKTLRCTWYSTMSSFGSAGFGSV